MSLPTTTGPGDGVRAPEERAAAPTVTTRLVLPPRTIAAVLLTLALLWLLVRLWPILLQLFVALLLTAALDPLVTRLQRRGVPRPVSVLLIVGVLVGALALLLLLLVPPLIDQGTALWEALPGYGARLERLARANSALVERLRGSASGGSADPRAVLTGFLAVGTGVVRGVASLLVVLVMTVYLLVDGERIYSWATRYLPLRQRVKARRALPEISRVVSGYVIGQTITSLLFGIFAFAVLTVLDVPQPLLLAIVAAFADAIPLVGVVIATAPAVGLALTVSIPTGIIVLALYIAYQQVENYLIVPRVYRGTLQISSFAVLIAVLIGAQLLGIVGVLLALPIAAVVPVVERIWGEDDPAPGG